LDLIDLSGDFWSEWQDLNLRPPRPERGDLRTGPLRFDVPVSAIKTRISRRRVLNRSIFNRPELSQLLSRKWEEKTRRSVSFGHSVRPFVMAR
jgi:hypothetical protein